MTLTCVLIGGIEQHEWKEIFGFYVSSCLDRLELVQNRETQLLSKRQRTPGRKLLLLAANYCTWPQTFVYLATTLVTNFCTGRKLFLLATNFCNQ